MKSAHPTLKEWLYDLRPANDPDRSDMHFSDIHCDGAILHCFVRGRGPSRGSARKKKGIQLKVSWLKTYLFTVLFWGIFANAHAADDRGWFSSIGSLNLGEGKYLSAGDAVEFLGILNVERIVSPSGRLATFRFDGQIFNADAALFYKVDLDNNFEILPVIGRDDGETAALCTTLKVAYSGRNIDLKKSDLASHLQVKHQGQLLSAFNVKKPLDIGSYNRNSTDFCVTGLQYSKQYEVTLLRALKQVKTFSTRLIRIWFLLPIRLSELQKLNLSQLKIF